MSDTPLEGFTVVGFESRMSETTADLIEKHGGTPMPAPSMQEVPLEEHDVVFDFAEALFDGEFDIDITTRGENFESVGLPGLNQSWRGVFVQIESSDIHAPVVASDISQIVEIDIELRAQDVRPVDVQSDGVSPARKYPT